MLRYKIGRKFSKFGNDDDGASLVEYAVALLVVTLVGAAILTLGGDISGIIDNSAGAF